MAGSERPSPAIQKGTAALVHELLGLRLPKPIVLVVPSYSERLEPDPLAEIMRDVHLKVRIFKICLECFLVKAATSAENMALDEKASAVTLVPGLLMGMGGPVAIRAPLGQISRAPASASTPCCRS